jgi:hypothetical protein
MNMQQIKVVKNGTHRVTWVERMASLKKGNRIRFKNEADFWDIKEVYPQIVERKDINCAWHVGGL